jgi:broad specificity phosphatase PhoE
MKTFTAQVSVPICFVRHAHAGMANAPYSRALSNQGIEELQRLKKNLENFFFDLIFTSPTARTKETAEILKEKEALVYEEKLLYDLLGKSSKILLEIQKHPDNNPCLSFKEKVEKRISQEQPRAVLIVAHSSVLNLLGITFASEYAEAFFDMAIDTGDGFLLIPHP